MLPAPSGGKLKRCAVGPYTFVCYVGWHGVNVEIVGLAGKLLTVSAPNLHPMDPCAHVDGGLVCGVCRNGLASLGLACQQSTGSMFTSHGWLGHGVAAGGYREPDVREIYLGPTWSMNW